MYKAIYEKSTGRVIAYCMPEQNLEILMSNYQNVDFIELDSLPMGLRQYTWRIDFKTMTLEKN